MRLNDGTNIKLVDVCQFVGTGLCLVWCLVIRCSTGGFLLPRIFSGVVSHIRDLLGHNILILSIPRL